MSSSPPETSPTTLTSVSASATSGHLIRLGALVLLPPLAIYSKHVTNNDNSIMTQSIFLILLSSLSYYIIASLLSISPPTSGLGLLLLRRVHDAKLNWHVHVIRSFLETGFWISVIGFTYLRSGNLEVDQACGAEMADTCNGSSHGEHDGILDGRWLAAVGWGTLSGVGVVLLGDVWTRYLAEHVCHVNSWEVRFQYTDSAKIFEPKSKQKSSNDDDTASLKSASSKSEDSLSLDNIHNNTLASFGSFVILYMISFLGYHTLSFIFSFPFSAPFHNVLANTLAVHVILATLAGVTFTATANILLRSSHTEEMGEVLLTRVTQAGENWRNHTKRSIQELGSWMIVVSGSFHLRHSVERVNGTNASWALVWALQLGTIAACTLILGRHYLLGEDKQFDEEVIENDQKKENLDEKKNNPQPMASLPSMSTCSVREKARKEGLVLLDGYWYSVGKFVPHHPGGEEVLAQYLGSDISMVFRVMHRNPDKIMKYRKPMRPATEDEMEALKIRRQNICQEMLEEYQASVEVITKTKPDIPEKFNLEAFEKDANELYQHFLEKGYFKPTVVWLIGKTLFTLFFLLLSITSMKLIPSASAFSFILPGVSLGLFWHQSGYMMHDAEHHNVAGNERCNDILGWLYGTVFLGVNGAWWREEHREHHALLNTFDENGSKDPQMIEDVWINNKNMIKFYGDELIHFLVNFQHILFLVIIFAFGRVGIMIDSTVTERKFRPWTKLGNVLHLALHYLILSQTDHPILVFIIAALWQSILSLQLLGNHHTKPWNQVHAATEGNFFVWQILTTQDFACPKWFEWFYGGLNFHYSHHLFPTLSREYFHITTPQIKDLCEKHGLPFVQVPILQCIKEMVMNLYEVRKEFAKNGRGSVALMYT